MVGILDVVLRRLHGEDRTPAGECQWERAPVTRPAARDEVFDTVVDHEPREGRRVPAGREPVIASLIEHQQAAQTGRALHHVANACHKTWCPFPLPQRWLKGAHTPNAAVAAHDKRCAQMAPPRTAQDDWVPDFLVTRRASVTHGCEPLASLPSGCEALRVGDEPR